MKRFCTSAAILLAMACASPAAAQQTRDYLTSIEADRIRDAEQPSQRIKLFLGYAADRLKKFQYELARPSADKRRAERLNALLRAYTGCMDDAVDIVQLGVEKQQDVRAGIKDLQSKTTEYLVVLDQLAAGPEKELYKGALEDAVGATRDARTAADKAAKEIAPPPVRRRQ